MRVVDTGHPARGPGDEMRSSLAGPTVVRKLLRGDGCASCGKPAGSTRVDAGWAIRGSDAKISRLETARSSFKRRDVADLLTLYGVHDDVERDGLFVLVDQANAPGWRQEYGDLLSSSAGTRLELEQCASVIRCYEAQFVPDLLQTTDYARALLGLHHPGVQPSEIERRIELLMKRQEALRGPQPCRLMGGRRRGGPAAPARKCRGIAPAARAAHRDQRAAARKDPGDAVHHLRGCRWRRYLFAFRRIRGR